MSFRKTYEFDNEEIEVEFEASIVNGGIGAYEFWGARGFDRRDEIDEITIETDLTPEQEAIVQADLDAGRLDDLAWDALSNARS